MKNIYFELTREFNAEKPIAILTSGQAVVFYRIAMMSKDADWIIEESATACEKILSILARHGAHYRPGAPLDVRWLSGGWSSHFQFIEKQGRRIRCDFLSRPPRLGKETISKLFASPQKDLLRVIDIKSLIHMKQTQRSKDYPIIGELARLLPPGEELEFTTDPDRLIALAPLYGKHSQRPSVKAALSGSGREAVITALALEINRLQEMDKTRLERYEKASERYFLKFRESGLSELPLLEAHEQIVRSAQQFLPHDPCS